MVMSNGDKIFMHYAGSSKSNGASGEGNFALSGGTGQFLGICGSGTLTTRSTAVGGMTIRIEGQYTLPTSNEIGLVCRWKRTGHPCLLRVAG
jgi:hypothetical protein